MWLKVGANLVRRGTLDFPAMAIAIRDMMQTYKICLCWLVYIYTIYIYMYVCVRGMYDNLWIYVQKFTFFIRHILCCCCCAQ